MATNTLRALPMAPLPLQAIVSIRERVVNKTSNPWLFWSPRILGILFALFVSLFALDVFGEGFGFWKTLLALLMHLIPTGLILIALVVSWRWDWVGAILFPALGLCYLLMAWNHLDWILMTSGPLFLIGALFALSWLTGAKLRTGA